MSDNEQANEERTVRCYNCNDDLPEGESLTDTDGDSWCEDCADDGLRCCERCDGFAPTGDGYIVEGDYLCSGCYTEVAHFCEGCDDYHYDENGCRTENSTSHIRHTVSRWLDSEQGAAGSPTGRYRAIRGSLVPLSGQAKHGAEWVYDGLLDRCRHTSRYLPRNAGSVGVDGWFEVPLEFESPLHREVASSLFWAVKNETDATFYHSQQEADYHPLRQLFGFAFESKSHANFWTFHPGDFVRDGSLRIEKIEQAVRDNRLPNGSKLTKRLSQLFARYRKHPDHPGDSAPQSENWPVEFAAIPWSPSKGSNSTLHYEVWPTFRTNACYLKVVGQLGWDTEALKDLVEHAGHVGSCQSRGNNNGYGFGAASLLCSDYRVLFFRNADTGGLVARSVVRYYRHGRYVMLAPSKLYLSEGNSSGTYYHATFDLLTRFCEAANHREANRPQQPRDSRGRFAQKLTWLPVAYDETNHSDGDSIISHLMEAGRGKYAARPLSEVIGYSGLVWTDYSPTFWLERPAYPGSDATFHYYNGDENIRMDCRQMNGGKRSDAQGSFQYVLRAGTRASGLTAYIPKGE